MDQSQSSIFRDGPITVEYLCQVLSRAVSINLPQEYGNWGAYNVFLCAIIALCISVKNALCNMWRANIYFFRINKDCNIGTVMIWYTYIFSVFRDKSCCGKKPVKFPVSNEKKLYKTVTVAARLLWKLNRLGMILHFLHQRSKKIISVWIRLIHH